MMEVGRWGRKHDLRFVSRWVGKERNSVKK